MLFALFVAMKTSQLVTNNLPNVTVNGRTLSVSHALSNSLSNENPGDNVIYTQGNMFWKGK